MNKYVFDKSTQTFIVKRKDQTPTKADVCHLCGCSLIECVACSLNDGGQHYWRVEADAFEKGELVEFMLTEDDGSGEPAWDIARVHDILEGGIVEFLTQGEAWGSFGHSVNSVFDDGTLDIWSIEIEYVRKFAP